jgi:EpsI family protein
MLESANSLSKSWRGALALSLCLFGTAALSVVFKPRVMPEAHARATVPMEALFPSQFGGWRLDPVMAPLIRPSDDRGMTRQIYDQVLERIYIDDAGRRIMLSVAYGRQQSVGLQMHRPEVCYKTGGFDISALAKGSLKLPSGANLSVTRLLARMEGRAEPITYWRLLGDEVVSDEGAFKLRQMQLGARSQIADGMLVRVSSIDNDTASGYALQEAFIRALDQAMAPEQRLRVMGVAAR